MSPLACRDKIKIKVMAVPGTIGIFSAYAERVRYAYLSKEVK